WGRQARSWLCGRRGGPATRERPCESRRVPGSRRRCTPPILNTPFWLKPARRRPLGAAVSNTHVMSNSDWTAWCARAGAAKVIRPARPSLSLDRVIGRILRTRRNIGGKRSISYLPAVGLQPDTTGVLGRLLVVSGFSGTHRKS